MFARSRNAVTSRDRPPCRQFGCAFPDGAPPPAPCKRHTRHPVTAGALHRVPVLLAMAVHLGASWALCMGLASAFFTTPPPGRHFADNGLSPRVNRHVLDRDFLRPAGPVALQRLQLGRVGPGELVERPFCRVGGSVTRIRFLCNSGRYRAGGPAEPEARRAGVGKGREAP